MRTQDRQFRGEAKRLAIEVASLRAQLATAERDLAGARELFSACGRENMRLSQAVIRTTHRRDAKRWRVIVTVDDDVLREFRYGDEFLRTMLAERVYGELQREAYKQDDVQPIFTERS